VVVLLANGGGRRAAPFFFLGRGAAIVAAVVSLPATEAHVEFVFYGCVRVSDGVDVPAAAVSLCSQRWWCQLPDLVLGLYRGGLRFVYQQC